MSQLLLYKSKINILMAVFLIGLLIPGVSLAEKPSNDWIDATLDLQEDIDLDAPLSQALWIGTHNSFNAHNNGYFEPNQTWSIKKQLKKNTRALGFDVHYLDLVFGTDKFILCHTGGDVGCSPGDRKFKDGLDDIVEFLETGNNRNEKVIILNIETFIDGHTSGFNEKIENHLFNKGVLYTPLDQIAAGKSSNQTTSDCSILNAKALTKRDVLDAGKNVILVTDKCKAGSNRWVERTFSGVEKWEEIHGDHGDHDEDTEGHADLHKYEKTKSIQTCLNEITSNESLLQAEIIRVFDSKVSGGAAELLVDVEASIDTLDPFSVAWSEDSTNYFLTAGAIPGYLGCGLNMFEMYNINNNKRYKLIWSWDEADGGYPNGSGDFAKLSGSTNKFRDAPTSLTYQYACRKVGTSDAPAFNEWVVTSDDLPGTFDQGEVRCLQETGGTHVFAVPRSQYELNELVEVRGDSSDLWLNYTNITGTWTASIGVIDDNWIDINDDGIHDDYDNTAPTAEAGGPYTVAEGSSVMLDASASKDTEQDAATLTYDWDFDGDSQYNNASGSTPTFSAVALDGPTSVLIGLRVTDDDGLTATGTATISVTNVAPTIIAVTNNGPIITNESTLITISASDPIDPISYGFDCDGNNSYEVGPQASNSAYCLITTAGSILVNVQVSDDDGGVTLDSTTVTVITPQEAIAKLQTDIQALINGGQLNKGQGNALIRNLNNGIKNGFINAVKGFINGGILTTAEGHPLVNTANRIIAAIEKGNG